MDPPHNSTTPPIPSSESQPPPSSPNPNPKPSPPSSQPPLYSHHHHIPPFSSSAAALSPPSLPAPSPRGPVAIGVPSHPPPSYAHFGGIARPAGDLAASSTVRMPKPAMQGMTGSVRPAGISPHQRPPVQSSLRPPSNAANQSPSQNFQGHNLSRASSLGSPSSAITSQGLALHNQPWLGSQGKPPIPSSPYRPQMAPSAMMQRSHLQPQQQPLTTPPPQPKGPMPTASPQQHNMPPLQHQQLSSMHQGQGHFGQQTPPQRLPQASPRPPQNTRVQALVNQKSSSLAVVQPNTVQSTQQNRIASTEMDESCNRILSKRTIHELVNQIDPSERLDPDVEDILVDIADEFVESITTFGCSLAKHRKSTTLEAKDILLHLEKNWNITLPGFGGEEIKSYKKPITNDIHKGRIAAIKKSMSVTETANTRNSAGHATGNAKGGLAKTSANISSQNIKT